jgi:hypothetical protein
MMRQKLKEREELHMKDATLAQGNQMLNLILQKRTPSEQLQRLMGSGLFSDLLEANLENGVDRNAFRSVIGLKPLNTFDAFVVTVNYGLTTEDAIEAGNYDWKNNNITSKNFPSKRKGTVDIEIILVHFNHPIYSDEAIKKLDEQGLRSAELPELLAFGAKYPDIQRDFPVIALGSVWQGPGGDRDCTSLYGRGSGRGLSLSWLDDGWDDYCRFAAVRK